MYKITEEDIQYLKQAYILASLYSDDPRTQNGAILVNRNTNIIGRGVNCFPNNVKKLEDRLERPKKYQFMEHAERNAIFSAAKAGFPTLNSVLYCPWYSCCDCARGIIQAGIKRVIGHKQVFEEYGDGAWAESILAGDKMLEEAGVETCLYDGNIGDIEILLNGKRWIP